MARILSLVDRAEAGAYYGGVLHSAGYEVATVCMSCDATAITSYVHADAALIDMEGDADGAVAALRGLMAWQPHCARILVYDGAGDRHLIEAVNVGQVNRILAKPFGDAELIAAVREAVETSKSYVPGAHDAVEGTMAVERLALRECLDQHMLRLFFQPIIDARSGDVLAFEALLRSSHPMLKTPLEVLRAAERLGMLNEVADVVSQEASYWLRRMPEGVRLFMNVHPRELADSVALARRLEPLRQAASRVVIEITERARLLEFDGWPASMGWLRDNGFDIALDDLGAGYSSLSMLADLEPQFMKVDMSIVRGIDADARKHRIMDLLCRFAETTGAKLVAEGVETQAEADALIRCGADMLQGYLFGTPAPYETQECVGD